MQDLTNKPGNDPSAPVDPERRSFLGWLLGVCAVVVSGLLSAPLVRFVLYPLRAKTTETDWADAGAVSDFTSIATPAQRTVAIEQVDGWRKIVSQKVIYITHDTNGQLRALSAVCPHLGCTVQWMASQNKFVSPCHGASFAPDGALLGGPAARVMDSLDTMVRNGRLMVRYQYFRQLVPAKEVIG